MSQGPTCPGSGADLTSRMEGHTDRVRALVAMHWKVMKGA